MTTTPRAPLLIAFLIVAVPTVAILFVVAMGVGWWMTVILVALFVAIAYVLSWLANKVMSMRVEWHAVNLEALKEKNRHEEKCLTSGYNPTNYTPLTRQIEAPAQQAAQLAPPDPRREHALRLLSATVESDKYGPKSVKVMTQKDAGAVGMIADDWSAAVSYLFLFGVATGNTGTIIKDSRNVSRLMADVARDAKDNEASAVMTLPEVRR